MLNVEEHGTYEPAAVEELELAHRVAYPTQQLQHHGRPERRGAGDESRNAKASGAHRQHMKCSPHKMQTSSSSLFLFFNIEYVILFLFFSSSSIFVSSFSPPFLLLFFYQISKFVSRLFFFSIFCNIICFFFLFSFLFLLFHFSSWRVS